MDIEMPIKSGLEAAEELKGQRCKVIILTTFARTGYFQRACKSRGEWIFIKRQPKRRIGKNDSQCYRRQKGLCT